MEEELEYIQHYIEFEKIRISDRLMIVNDIEQITDQRIKIAPLILIVFIENAFKHSKNSLKQEIEIDVSLKIIDNFICLQVSNSYYKEINQGNHLDESSGLGLVNTVKRLDLVYGSDYELLQDIINDRYIVNLRLKIIE